MLEGITKPQQMALSFIERNPDRYPFKELSDQAEVSALTAVFKKEIRRLKARDPDLFTQ